MKTILKEIEKEYCTIKKVSICNCTSVIKKKEIQNILQNEIFAECNLIHGFKVKPIFSSLNREYAGLIGNTVALVTEIMGHLFRYGIYKGNFEKEMIGANECLSALDKKHEKKFNEYLSKVTEFKDNRSIITLKTIDKLFDYALKMSIFEKAYRESNLNKLFEIDDNTYNAIINEVKAISRYTYCFLKNKEDIIKESFCSNPVFTSEYAGINADGGFIINDGLYNLKTKKNHKPNTEDICQMILYYLLNRTNNIANKFNNMPFDKLYNINNLYIYNSRFAYTYEIKIKELTDKEVDRIMFKIYSIIMEPYKNIVFHTSK